MAKNAAILVEDCKGKILYIRERGSNVWSIPKGACLKGETPSDCALRVLFEYTGISAFTDSEHLKSEFKSIRFVDDNTIFKLFRYHPPCEYFQRLSSCSSEVHNEYEYKWFDVELSTESLDYKINTNPLLSLAMG